MNVEEAISGIECGSILRIPMDNIYVFDLSGKNAELMSKGITDVESYDDFIFSKMKEVGATVGFGKWNENRTVYRGFELFGSDNRTVHMAIDVWVPAGTEILCPIPAKIHSFRRPAQTVRRSLAFRSKAIFATDRADPRRVPPPGTL